MKIKTTNIITLFLLFITLNIFGQSYNKLWKEVYASEHQDLPKTAIKACDNIIQKAQKEHQSGQLLKAYLYKESFKTKISPDSFYVQIEEMEKWAIKAQNPVDCMVIHCILADMYESYFNNNRYRIKKETTVLNMDSKDIREWTDLQFYNIIIKHIDASLVNINLLHQKKTNIYIPFIENEWGSHFFNHDMLHVIAKSDINNLNCFINDMNYKEKAIHKIDDIYQRLKSIYSTDKEESAKTLVALDYLNFKHFINNDSKIYIDSLNQLIQESNRSNPICSELYLAKANEAFSKNEKTKALEICNKALQLYPKYERIQTIKKLKNEILLPYVFIQNIDNFIYPLSMAKLKVSHKNMDGFTLQIYKIPNDILINKLKLSQCRLISSKYYKLKRSYDFSLQTDSFNMTIPDLGLYIIKLKEDDTPNIINNIIRISRLKLLTMKLSADNYDIAVVDAQTGKPVDDATVLAYDINKKLLLTQKTDINGRTIFKTNQNNLIYYVRAIKGNDLYMNTQYVNNGTIFLRSNRSDTINKIILITDRNIYRPGQIIHLKGIVYQQKGDRADVKSAMSVNLSLRDANHQEIANKKTYTNEFGSFTTDFTLPASCLNGYFSIETNSNQSISFRVEEYKKPTFEITTDTLKSSYSLGDTIYIRGKAKSFSGIPITGTTVKYTINRGRWSWWRLDDNIIINNDSVKISNDGSFKIPVYLRGDMNIEKNIQSLSRQSNGIYYTFTISVNITTQSGETQSEKVILAAGKNALIMKLSTDKPICKDKPIRISFEAKNLLQKPIDTSITYKLFEVNGIKYDTVDQGNITANKDVVMNKWRELPSGIYKLILSTKDSQSKEIVQEQNITIFSIRDKSPANNADIWYYTENVDENDRSTFDIQHPAKFYFGTSYKDATILMDIFSNGKRIESKEFTLSDKIQSFEYPYKESYKDGIAINFCFVKKGIIYQKTVIFEKSVSNHRLKIKWTVFRNKLFPGQKEEWHLNISTSDNKPADAEMLACMYDSSLDKIAKRDFTSNNISFTRDIPYLEWENHSYFNLYLNYMDKSPEIIIKPLDFDTFSYPKYSFYNNPLIIKARGLNVVKETNINHKKIGILNVVETTDAYGSQKNDETEANGIRSNFAETAFFYPQLRTDASGNISIVFTLPESLTRWKFNGFAHTKDLMTGNLTANITASKEFMLSPNIPRFVRAGDQTSVTATVSNLSDKLINAKVKLELFDPITGNVLFTKIKPININVKENRTISFDFTATDRYDILGCRMTAEGNTFSDGEQHVIPVLSNKIMTTEAIPLPVNGKQSHQFSLNQLFNYHSKTATHRKLTIEYVGNPIWYAIQSLPSLSSPNNDNAVSWATTLYANTLASYIVNSIPHLKALFENWRLNDKNKDSFLTNLQKNQELKNILLNESPWVLDAKNEQEQKERIFTLFDISNIKNNQALAIEKLRQLQNKEGAWCWYKGMPDNIYITEYILQLTTHLQMLTKEPLPIGIKKMQSEAFLFLHKKNQQEYETAQKAEKEGQKIQNIPDITLRYLYLVAISNEKVPAQYQRAYRYFLSKVNIKPESQNIGEKSLAAIILNKAGEKNIARNYIASIKEHLSQSNEMGMYFDFNENNSSLTWNSSRISTHIAAMEALALIGNDTTTVERMKQWLLKQKQTQQWNSPVTTADAVYILLNGKNNKLKDNDKVRITLGGKAINTTLQRDNMQNYIKQTFNNRPEIDARTVEIKKESEGIGWGAIYAQYEDNISTIKRQNNTIFEIEKNMFVKHIVDNKEELQPIKDGSSLKIGDIVVARIVIKLNRPMEFIQLKEQHAACLEPINYLSGYHYNMELGGYYEDIKDASVNYFFNSLSKGVYTFEINYRIDRVGNYESGLSSLQCAYAPEFITHSHSIRIKIKP